MMTKLSSVDVEWPDRPQLEMRRLVEIPWLMEYTPPTSVIFKMLKDDPLIFVDDQSRADHTVIIVWRTSKESDPEAARVPISRANILLGVAAEGRLSSDYVRILPEPEEEKDIQVSQASWVIFYTLITMLNKKVDSQAGASVPSLGAEP